MGGGQVIIEVALDAIGALMAGSGTQSSIMDIVSNRANVDETQGGWMLYGLEDGNWVGWYGTATWMCTEQGAEEHWQWVGSGDTQGGKLQLFCSMQLDDETGSIALAVWNRFPFMAMSINVCCIG